MKRVKSKKQIKSAPKYQNGDIFNKQYMAMTPEQEQLKPYGIPNFPKPQAFNDPTEEINLPVNTRPSMYERTMAGAMMTPYGEQLRQQGVDAITPQTEVQERFANQMVAQNNIDSGNNEKFQFFNPYLGRDPQTSAYGLGESIQNKDALGIAGNAIHLLSNLGRNAFAGAGNAKREQYVMQDAMEKYREGLKPAPMMKQDGGYIKSGNTDINFNDVTKISRDLGVNFTPEFAQSYFSTQTELPQAPQRPIKYIQKVSTEGYRDNSRLAPGEYQKVYYTDPYNAKVENQDYEYLTDSGFNELKRMNNYRIYQEGLNKPKDNRVASFQDGGMAGQMPPQEEQQAGQEQQLMMQVAEAISQGADPNQIVEQLIQNGVPEETAVQMVQMIMQQMQGGEQAPQEEMYEMGGIKKKSLPKLLTGEYTAEKDDVEEEDTVAELEKGEFIKTPEGEITQVLGKSHAQGGVQLTEEQLPENSEILSDHLKVSADLAKTLKEIGVTSKDTYAKALDKWTAKSGLKKIVEEQEEMIKKLEAQSKLLVERPSSKDTIKLNTTLLQEEISELEKEKEPLLKEKQAIFDQLFAAQEASKPQEKQEGMMEKGGTFNNDIIVKYAKKHGISPERANELVNEYKNGGVTKYQNAGTVEYPQYQSEAGLPPYVLKKGEGFSPDNQINFYRQALGLGYTGKNNQGDIQRFMNKVRPQDVLDYFDPEKGNQPLTAKHVDLLKKNAPWAFKNSGISSSKASADYTTEEKSKLKEAYGLGDENGMLKSDYTNFILEGFADNKWDWRAPIVGLAPLTPAGIVNTPQMQAPIAVNPFLPQTQTAPQAEIAAQKEDKFSNLDNAQRARTGLMALPNQYAQLPDPLQGALKLEYRPNLMENQNITADPIVAEIRRSEQNAMQSIQNLPDEQRAAAAAQIQANTQEQFNKVMSQVQAQNLQSNSAVANQNAQILNNSQDINNRYLSDYENKIYKAQAITDADRRNYFLHNQKVNLENFNAINKANLYNQLADNYQLTDRGLELYNSPQLSYDGISADQLRQNTLRNAEKIKAEEKKAAKKAVGKNGGRFKKRT